MLILLPMVTPEIIMGISLLIFFGQLFGQNGSMGQIAIAHITFCISYVAVVVRARARNMDPHLEEAARDLGASSFEAFWHVTLPLIAPAVGAGAMLAFALSFDDLVVTAFNAGVGSTTLPIFIYSSIKFGVTPQINAISTIIVAVVAWPCSSPGGSGRSAATTCDRPPRSPPLPSPADRACRSPGRRSASCDHAAGSSATGRAAEPAASARPRRPWAIASASTALSPNRRSE